MYFQHNPGLPAARQRRIASSFRDHSLFQIFRISLTSLLQLKSDGISYICYEHDCTHFQSFKLMPVLWI